MNKLEKYLTLAGLFKKAGFNLYLVGGAVRDYLLGVELDDVDVTTDATPMDIKTFFEGEANYVFEKFGAVIINFEGVKFELTTLRKENKYLDYRHPNKIEFVKDLSLDYVRRDFTINALYLDSDLKVYDFCLGQEDLKNKILRFIGEPNERIKEDPLRILRAIRFALILDFDFEKDTYLALKNNVNLIEKLNKDKVRQELSKIKNVQNDRKISLFNVFNITYLLDMIK